MNIHLPKTDVLLDFYLYEVDVSLVKLDVEN